MDAAERDAVRVYLAEVLARKGDERPFTDEESLLVTGRMDSVDVMDVVVFLEDRFGLDFSDHLFDQSDFDSVRSIMDLTDQMRSRQG